MRQWLAQERDQLPLWLPVGLGAGIAAWFAIPLREGWLAFMAIAGGIGIAGIALLGWGREGRAILIFCMAAILGCGLIWWRAEQAASFGHLVTPRVVTITGRVTKIERIDARGIYRLQLEPATKDLPARIRLNVPLDDANPSIAPGATINVRARLMPPPPASFPGAYDFERVAWFVGIGAAGRAIGPVDIIKHGNISDIWITIDIMRERLTRHIHARLPGSAGGIAAAFVTGDEGAITLADVDAMRASGLAHLLSISGLHVSAVVAGSMIILLRLLALSRTLAIRLTLPLVAGAGGAIAGIAYTLLAGAQVPTIRSCLTAILILAALALGREPLSLRLVAAGALVVLLLWPEALIGPSFQLSFAAITAIVAFHTHPRIAPLFRLREEGFAARMARSFASILATGLIVELALIPIAMFHFHRTGLYGSLANLIAIPLTTLVIMPLEVLGLTLDIVGAGAPVWALAGVSIRLLLGVAQVTSALPGSVAALPTMPDAAFALMIAGGLWICLWRSPLRYAGIVVFIAGAIGALRAPAPDLLVTGDGRHVAVRTASGAVAMLRDRAGDYVRDVASEVAASEVSPLRLGDLPFARCSADLCVAILRKGGRDWRVAMTRSPYLLRWADMIRQCEMADIVISERRLPAGCHPRWLKIDRASLQRSGGLAIFLELQRLERVSSDSDDHPWIRSRRLSSASYLR